MNESDVPLREPACARCGHGLGEHAPACEVGAWGGAPCGCLALIEDLARPVLPYGNSNPSSGFSGSVTSEAAVRAQDVDGRTLDKQVTTLRLMSEEVRRIGGDVYGRANGFTWQELDWATSWGHGSTSRVLSDLHKAGRLARLAEKRNNCEVYVLPEYVNGRETRQHGGRPKETRTFVSEGTVEVPSYDQNGEPVEVHAKVLVHIYADGSMDAAVKMEPSDRWSRWGMPVDLKEEV